MPGILPMKYVILRMELIIMTFYTLQKAHIVDWYILLFQVFDESSQQSLCWSF